MPRLPAGRPIVETRGRADMDVDAERILVLAQNPADAALMRTLLDDAGLEGAIYGDIADVTRELGVAAGALLLTEDALVESGVQHLVAALQRQPPWSDIPILLMCAPPGADCAVGSTAINLLGNVMVLERPVPTATLVSALRSSIRARRRQYDLHARMEALQQSEERFRFLADNIPSFVWVTAPDGSLVYANDKWFDYSGQALDRDTRQWPALALHPEDRDYCLQQWALALREGREFEIEVRSRRRDGIYLWFVMRAVPLKDRTGRIVSWFGVSTEINEQKKAERTAQFLADASAALADITGYEDTLRRVAALAVPDFADWCTVDMLRDGTLHRLAVMHVDPARVPLAFELYRRHPPSRDADSGLRRVIAEGRPEMRSAAGPEALAGPERDPSELELIRALGVNSYICVPLAHRGAVMGVITFVHGDSGQRYTDSDLRVAEDIAQRASVAIDNAVLYRELQDAHRRKDEFLATLAHELRNPLAPIRSSLQVMTLTDRADAVAQARHIMERQIDQMVRLIDDLLDVSRITRGRLELRKSRVELGAVIGNAVDTARPLIEASGHRLDIELPPEKVWLDADPVRLAQVFSNLLNNAAKYMEPGGTIRIAGTLRNDRVSVAVSDTGMGIPPEHLSTIFEMFSQVDRSIGRAHGGLGIGLTLVKRLVEMHDGTVEARSEGPGEGSTFTVSLPVLVAEDAARPSAAASAAASTERHRILVVDDNADVVESLGMVLRLMGHEVRTVPDGLQAVEQANEFAPELILLDIGMPGIDGYEAARRIRAQGNGRGRRAVLVALTGWGQESDRRRSIESGFDHHFTKPVDPAALERLVAALPSDAAADGGGRADPV